MQAVGSGWKTYPETVVTGLGGQMGRDFVRDRLQMSQVNGVLVGSVLCARCAHH